MPFPVFSRGISWGGSRISWGGLRINASQRRLSLGVPGACSPRKFLILGPLKYDFQRFQGQFVVVELSWFTFFNHTFVYVFTFSLEGSTEPPEPPLDPPQISHQKDTHDWEQKTFIKSTFAMSSSCTCQGYRSLIHRKSLTRLYQNNKAAKTRKC